MQIDDTSENFQDEYTVTPAQKEWRPSDTDTTSVISTALTLIRNSENLSSTYF